MGNKVYSVASTDCMDPEPIETDIVGTYRMRSKAVSACIDYVVERLCLRPDIRCAFINDENHDVKRGLSRLTGISAKRLEKKFAYNLKDGWSMSDKLNAAVREYLAGELLGGIYDIYAPGLGFAFFYVIENEMG